MNLLARSILSPPGARCKLPLWATTLLLPLVVALAGSPVGAQEPRPPGDQGPAVTAPPRRPPPRPRLPSVWSTRLPNGLQVALVRPDARRLVSLCTLVRVGSRDEVRPSVSGYAALLQRLLEAGTTSWPRARLERRYRQRGVVTRSVTTRDATIFCATGPRSALPAMVEIESHRAQHATYGEEALRQAAMALLREHDAAARDPASAMSAALHRRAFQRHPYRHRPLGRRDAVARLPRQLASSRVFRARYYRPGNTIVFVVGAVPREETLALMRARYGGWRGQRWRTRTPEEPPLGAERQHAMEWRAPTEPRLLVGYRVPGGSRSAALQALLGVLLFGRQSPLSLTLVDEGRSCRALEARPGSSRDPYLFRYLVTAPSVLGLMRARPAIDKEIALLRLGHLAPERLEAARSHLLYRMAETVERPEALALGLARAAAVTGDPQALKHVVHHLTTAKAADLTAFARKHLVRANRVIVSLSGPRPQTPELVEP